MSIGASAVNIGIVHQMLAGIRIGINAMTENRSLAPENMSFLYTQMSLKESCDVMTQIYLACPVKARHTSSVDFHVLVDFKGKPARKQTE